MDKAQSFGNPLENIGYATSLQDALVEFVGYTPVYVTKTENSNLVAFQHPENAVYIVGPGYGGLVAPDDTLSVRVEYRDPVVVLWATVALGIVLYDRSAKWPL